MSIYHLHAQVISRKTGRSSVAAAAYRAAQKLIDRLTGLIHDFTRKRGVDFSLVMLPPNAPSRFADRNVLWEEVEKIEKRKDAQLARELDVALPQCLPREAQIELAKQFVQDTFVKAGMCADLNVHDLDSGNPHFHVMLTTRDVDADGFGKKNRAWNDRDLLVHWREQWAAYANAALERHGFDDRIDHRSYAEQGITDREPQVHLGPVRHAMQKKGKSVDSIDPQLEWQQLKRAAQQSANDKIKDAQLYARIEGIQNELEQLEQQQQLHAERERAHEQQQLEARISAVRDAIAAENAEQQRLTDSITRAQSEQQQLEQQLHAEPERAHEQQQLEARISAIRDAIAAENVRQREFEQYIEHTQRELDERRTDASKVQESIARTHNYVQQAQDKQSQFKRELEEALRKYADARAEHEKAEKRKRADEPRNKEAQRLHEFKRLNFLERRKQIHGLEQDVERTEAEQQSNSAELERAKNDITEIRRSIAFTEHTADKIRELEKEIAVLEETAPSPEQIATFERFKIEIQRNLHANAIYYTSNEEIHRKATERFHRHYAEKPRYEHDHEQDVEIVRTKTRF